MKAINEFINGAANTSSNGILWGSINGIETSVIVYTFANNIAIVDAHKKVSNIFLCSILV